MTLTDALAAAIERLDWSSIWDEEPVGNDGTFVATLNGKRAATAILAAMPDWPLVPKETSLAYDTGFQDGLGEAGAEIARLRPDAQRWRDAEAEGHIVDFTEDGYGLQHPPSCRPNLTGCAYHLWLADDDGPVLLQGGRYRMTLVSPNGYDQVEYAAIVNPEA